MELAFRVALTLALENGMHSLKEQSAKHFTNVWDRLTPNLAVVAVVLLAAWMGDKDGGYFVGDWTPAAMVVAVLVLVISAAGMLFYFYVRRGEPEAALVYYRKALALNPLEAGLKKHVGQLKKATAPDDEQ